MGKSSHILSIPKVLRLEVMQLDFGEAAVVVELASEPPKRWLEALKREMANTEGLESASAKFDGCLSTSWDWNQVSEALSAKSAACLPQSTKGGYPAVVIPRRRRWLQHAFQPHQTRPGCPRNQRCLKDQVRRLRE